ncbi:hypothetical protein ON010_g18271 [Phytophthora cinnamomi]|nr:hypothetical protein ON010_g18271 [Phytophthora cinnamomi]
MEPVPWVPNILPVQVVKIGQFAIAVTNFEVTTMAGRRIRDTVKTALAGAGVTEVELASISNAYAQYLTTKEEYLTQNYEGASTLFGPNQLAAVQQELARVAASVADSSVQLDVGPTPLQLDRSSLITLQTGVVFDSSPLLRSFSHVRTQPSSSYAVGSVASAVFAGAHPKNALALVSSFCDVQKLGSSGSYSTVMTDAHWDLRYHWERHLIAESKNTCEWNIRKGGSTSVAGTYRFMHRGYSKSLLGALTAYTATSNAFELRLSRANRQGAEPRGSPLPANVLIADYERNSWRFTRVDVLATTRTIAVFNGTKYAKAAYEYEGKQNIPAAPLSLPRAAIDFFRNTAQRNLPLPAQLGTTPNFTSPSLHHDQHHQVPTIALATLPLSEASVQNAGPDSTRHQMVHSSRIT